MTHAAQGDSPTESTIRTLLRSTAAGDREAISQLYDLLATEIYTVCARYLSETAHRDDAMLTIWRYIWTHARMLGDGHSSARERILRWAAACSRDYEVATRASVTLAS